MDKTTDQLLNLLEAEIDTTDSEPKYCIIDPDRREIYIDPDYQILGVESDEKADRILFRCPKTVGDGLDLTQYQLRINYQNANDQKGQYLVEDVTDDGEDILFSWLLHRPVTAYQGTVRFIVCAISVEEGEVKNEWNTTVAQCDVLEGLEVENPVIPAPEEDLIAQLIQQMQDKVEQAQQALEAIEAAKTESVQAVETAKEEATSEITTAKTGALESIETAKDEAIEEIENTGVPLEDIEKLAIKETAEGNPTIISDSADWRLQSLNVYGQSEQASTTGAQLLDSSLYKDSATGSGVTYTKQSDGSIKRTGTATDSTGNLWFGGGFYESKDHPKYRVLFTLQAGTYTVKDCQLFSLSVAYSNTFTIEEPLEISGLRNTDFVVGKTYNDVIYPMLNEGSTALPFEPYTGGKPSPSPEYPQEIISKEIGEIRVTNGADLSQTITLTEPITLRGIPVDSGGNVTIDGQQYVADEIDFNRGVYVQRTGKIVISDITKNNIDLSTTGSRFSATTPNKMSEVRRTPALCNYFPYNNVPMGSFSTEGNYIATDEPKKVFFRLDEDITIEEFRQRFPDLTAYYILEIPSEIPLAAEDVSAYRTLKTYYPNTIIDTGAWAKVNYVADTKMYIDKQVTALSEAMLER